MKYLEELVMLLNRTNEIMYPTTQEEITQTIKNLGLNQKLPEAYLEFLLTLGKGTNKYYMLGDSWTIDELPYMKSGLQELLEENDSSLELKDDDFPFWSHQGYMYTFFNLNEGDNPPVYFYDESTDTDEFVKVAHKLSDFLFLVAFGNNKAFEAVI